MGLSVEDCPPFLENIQQESKIKIRRFGPLFRPSIRAPHDVIIYDSVRDGKESLRLRTKTEGVCVYEIEREIHRSSRQRERES